MINSLWHVSASESNSKNAKDHIRFQTIAADTIQDIAELSVRHVWSPCVWKNGYRLARNFAGCAVGVLDFDSGKPSLSEACAAIECNHIVITTKSHQVEKVTATRITPPCDRYRIILPLSRQMALENSRYKWQMAYLHRKFPGADRSCIDTARYYWPGTKIISVKANGENFNLPDAPSEDRLRENLHRAINRVRRQISAGIIPPWVRCFLAVGIGIGERRPMIFKCAACLARCGFSLNETINLIIRSPFDRVGIDYSEIERTIGNGFKAGKEKIR
jgi:hypothetical protein